MIFALLAMLFLAHPSVDRGEPLILEGADHFTVTGRGATVDLVGNVRFHRGDVRLRADRALWDRAQDVVTFSGNFKVESPSGTIHSDMGRYERTTGSAWAMGAARLVDSSGKVTLTAAQVRYSRPERLVEAVGDPVFRQQDAKDTLEVRALRLLWQERERVAQAFDNVRLRKGGMTATASKARLEEQSRRLFLSGSPTALMGERRLRGGEMLLLVDLKTRKIREISVYRKAEGEFQGDPDAKGQIQNGRLYGDTLHALVKDDALEDVLVWKGARSLSWNGADTGRRNELEGDSLHFAFEAGKGKGLRQVRAYHHTTGRFRGESDSAGVFQCGTLSGDTLVADLENGAMKTISVWPKAKGSSWKTSDTARRDELEGDSVAFTFDGRKIASARARGTTKEAAKSIYHHVENGRLKGRNEARGALIRMAFKDGKIRRVRVDGASRGVYYGEPKPGAAKDTTQLGKALPPPAPSRK